MQVTDANELRGLEVRSNDGDKVGKVDDVFLDQATGRPEWVAVKTGMFGGHVSLVPIAAAERQDGDTIVVPFDKDVIKNAPHSDPEDNLGEAEEAELFRYYGVPYGGETVTATGGPQGVGQGDLTGQRTGYTGAEGHDTSGPTTDDAMTRSEERLRVGKENVETGRARLRKYVVTENVTQTVPVTREEVRVEREPITDANAGAAMDGPAISEEEHEVVLHEERPVVAKEAVPVERVRLGTETVTDERTVSEDVRKEQIETDGVDTDRAR